MSTESFKNITFGKNILENLTVGMYSDKRITYREYIQNSCDSIRKAINNKILSSEQAKIDVDIDVKNRNIEICDNGIGVPRADFGRVLGDIANSDKIRGDDMGFRGIGRLCGLAYCSEMKFVSTAFGETSVCTMTWNANKMRKMLNATQKYSAGEVLSEILDISYDNNGSMANEHYFKVIMYDVTAESLELLDDGEIRKYLSFVVPVPYNTKFMFYNDIYEYAKKINQPIEEYKIFVNDEIILKEYSADIYESNRIRDEITGLEFHGFYGEANELLAWMWFGISGLEGAIEESEKNPHRCLRLRKSNIQIGDENTLRPLHKEQRANSYFIGEIFAVHHELTPNARRDYFNQNSILSDFEEKLKEYFKRLHELRYYASDRRSDLKKVNAYIETENLFKEKEKSGFSGDVEREKLEEDLNKKRLEADKSINRSKKAEQQQQSEHKEADALTLRINENVRRNLSKKEKEVDIKKLEDKLSQINFYDSAEDLRKSKPKYLIGELYQYPRETRNVVSRIYDIIKEQHPKIADELISYIHQDLKSKRNRK